MAPKFWCHSESYFCVCDLVFPFESLRKMAVTAPALIASGKGRGLHSSRECHLRRWSRNGALEIVQCNAELRTIYVWCRLCAISLLGTHKVPLDWRLALQFWEFFLYYLFYLLHFFPSWIKFSSVWIMIIHYDQVELIWRILEYIQYTVRKLINVIHLINKEEKLYNRLNRSRTRGQ